VLQLNVYGLYLKLMLTFRCTFIFVCIIVSVFLSVFLPVFLSVWHNKGVHKYVSNLPEVYCMKVERPGVEPATHCSTVNVRRPNYTERYNASAHCVFVCQFTQDFVHDCMEMVFAYFSDPTRVSRFADALEEEMVHHGFILQHCNVVNANLRDVSASRMSVPTMISVPYMITGQLCSAQFLGCSV